MPAESATTILVVGDIHGHWRDADTEFLHRARPDMVLFVGDLGDEDVDMVRRVAAVQVPKAVILGNHDAWASFSKDRPTPQLRDSLAALGDDHLAYRVRELPAAGLSMLGARPFSWGGRSLRSANVYGDLFGVRTVEDSVRRIVDAARGAHHRDLLILAHNGPTGLSGRPTDIYGKDFGRSPSGDWGDRDLERAIARIRDMQLRVRCVVAGHMHHRVARPRGEERVRFVRRDGVLYVNPAVVPRLRKLGDVEVAHYMRMTWKRGELLEIDEIWVDAHGTTCDRGALEIVDL